MNTTTSAQYRFDVPVLITADRLLTPSPDECSDGSRWAELLNSMAPGTVDGVVIPVESGPQARQALPGLMWLSWLRWSAATPIRFVPVLVVAWQSLPRILRQSLDLLLVSGGTEFMRLPNEIVQTSQTRLDEFIEWVRMTKPELQDKTPYCTPEELQRMVLSGAAEANRATHHDLANDNYAAYRLWHGYIYLLRQQSGSTDKRISEAADRSVKELSDANPSFVPIIDKKQHHPFFRQLEVLQSQQRLPGYPIIESADEIMQRHLKSGMHRHARVLLVDDEFQKGTAEALLRIFFGAAQTDSDMVDFVRAQGEWVYSQKSPEQPDHRKARFVCVENVQLARQWLAKWGVLRPENRGEHEGWLRSWNLRLKEIGWLRDESHSSLSANDRARLVYPLDDDELRPVRMKTIVLLDLRLDRSEVVPNYAAEQFSSIVLRNEIKQSETEVPVIMFTASRQAINFSQVMSDATSVDGWLIKEAPDVLRDDRNSAQAVLYLLSRIHMLCARGDWYREELGWSDKWIDWGNRVFHGEQQSLCSEFIDNASTSLFERIRAGVVSGRDEFAEYWNRNRGTAYVGFITENIPEPPAFQFLLVRMVARRIAVATLLLTADIHDERLDWDATSFSAAVRGAEFSATAEYIYDGVEFQRDLQIKTKRLPILAQLLKPEYEWLLQLDWPKDRHLLVQQEIQRHMATAYPSSKDKKHAATGKTH